MEIIDTHTHINDERFNDDFDAVLKRQAEVGITRLVIPAVDSKSHQSMIDLAKRYPKNIFPLMGVHPTTVNDMPDSYMDELAIMEKLLIEAPVRFYGIGEIGLDRHWSDEYLEAQKLILCRQLDLAIEYNLPVVFHVREAWDDIIPIIEQYRGRIRGVFHSFAGDKDIYLYIKELGDFSFGISGPVTYKKSAVAKVVEHIDINDILLETDAPYLPPEPYRGRRNESTYLIEIAAKIASIKGIDIEEVARVTTHNAIRVFGL